MVHSFDGYNDIIRLDRGERLSDALEQFATQTKCQGAWLSGVGGASEIELGFYRLDSKSYQWKTFSNLHEVVNLSGNLAIGDDGQPAFHLHGVFSDENYQTVGGHVKDFVAGGTVELFVHRTYKPLGRKLDPEVGLKTLDL